MKTVTYEEFLDFGPCWLDEEGGAERLKAYFDRFGGRMSAMDILNLDDISAEDKLWSVLREEFIPAPILHEFACVCAEYALTLIDNPDPRSIKAIEVKRAWMRGEATDEELAAAWNAAWDACDAAWAAARAATRVASDAARVAAWAAAWAARAAAWVADWDAARAARTARAAARNAARVADLDAARAARVAVCEAQVAYLIMTLEEEI